MATLFNPQFQTGSHHPVFQGVSIVPHKMTPGTSPHKMMPGFYPHGLVPGSSPYGLQSHVGNPAQPGSMIIFPDKPKPKKAATTRLRSARPSLRASSTSTRGAVKDCIEKGIAACKHHDTTCPGGIIRGCIKGALGWPVPNPSPWWAGAQISPRNIAMLKRQGMRNPVAVLSGERIPGMNRRQRRQLRKALRAHRVTRGTCDPACPKDTPVCCGDGRCVSTPSTCWEDAYRNNPHFTFFTGKQWGIQRNPSFSAFVTAQRGRRRSKSRHSFPDCIDDKGCPGDEICVHGICQQQIII